MKNLPKNCERIYPGAYRIADPLDVYMFLIVGEERALLIDTGYGTMDLKKIVPELIKDAAGENADKIELIVCNTHGHIDHNGMNYAYPECYLDDADGDVYAMHADPVERENFIKKLFGKWYGICSHLPVLGKMIKKICYMEPANIVPMPETFDLGGKTIKVIKTPGHTPGSVCLLDEKEKALFSGDSVCDEGVLLMVDYSCSVAEFKKSILSLIDMHEAEEFSIIYPSHHKKELDRSFLDDYITLADKILDGEEEGIYLDTVAGDGWKVDYKTISISYKKDNIR